MNNEETNNQISEKIEVLSGIEAIRTRPGMYISSVENPNVIAREVLNNSMDEIFSTSFSRNRIYVHQNYNGYYMTCDDQRGLSIKWLESGSSERITQAEAACTLLHSGSKFKNTSAKSGQNGLGLVACNALSTRFILISKITGDNYDKSIKDVYDLWVGSKNKKDLFYAIGFEKGVKKFETAGSLKKLSKFLFSDVPGGYREIPSGYSTYVLFTPDPEIFDSVKISVPVKVIENFLLIMNRFYKKKVEVYVDDVLYDREKGVYKYEFIKKIIPANTSMNPELGVYVTFDVDPTLPGREYDGSVNGLETSGLHIQYIEDCFSQALSKTYGISHKYLTNGLRMKVILLASEVMYDSQVKTRLKSISKVRLTDFEPVAKEFVKIFKSDPDYWGAYVDALNFLANSMKSLSATEKAQQMIDRASGTAFYKNKSNLVDGFSDATLKNRWDCELFLTEGLSPAGSLKSGRKSIGGFLKEAICPLRGKVLNVSNVDIDKALDNKEISTIFTLLGVGIDGNNVTSGCSTPQEAMEMLQKYSRYGKLIIAVDSD